MSELINLQRNRADFRWRLLTTVSSLALLASVSGARDAHAEDTDRPVVWIELGANLERVDSGQQAFTPPFVANNPGSTAFDPVSPAEAQKPPGFSFGADSKILFQPEDSNWVFSASVRYGRSNGNRDFHQTAKNKPFYKHLVFGNHTVYPPHTYTPFTANFLAVAEKQGESHAIIDFQAGRDFGLGLFGRAGTSVLSAGIRFAQFTSRMQSSLQARPDLEFRMIHYPNANNPYASGTIPNHRYHQYEATGQSARSFRGIGPSLSWNASAPFAGNPENSELSVDWGANAAILFGRQKANVQHKTSAQYFGYYKYPGGSGVGYDHPQVNLRRARTITVPNVGGFAGVSISHANAKISIGYRGDFFFGAMDTGFDTVKRSTIGFYGPFASVSIGLGG